jgi:soluble lytic murein transglycosylase-like protein
MKIIVPALTLSAFLAFQVAADPTIFANAWRMPVPPHLPERFAIPPPTFTLNEVVAAASRKHRVPQAMIKSVIAAESGFRPDAVSNKGAIGLMQLMPATAEEMGADPSVPEQNIDAGTQYLGQLIFRYRNTRDKFKRAVAAYNAGPGMVDRYHGVPPFRETRTYVKRVLGLYKVYALAQP